MLSPAEGTWEQMVYVDSMAKRRDITNRLFHIPRLDGNNGLVVYHTTAGNWVLETTADDGTQKSISFADTYTPDGWHRFGIKWNATEAKIFVDGILRGTITNPTLPSAFGTNAYVGSKADAGRWLNTIHDDINISSIARSDADMQARGTSTSPLSADNFTTLKMDFDNGLSEVDTISPIVNNTDPVNNETNVPINKQVAVNFSEPVQAGTNINEITISNGGTPVDYTYGISGNVLTLDPVSNLDYSTSYAVYIPAGAVKDISGNALVADYNFNFNTMASSDTTLPVVSLASPTDWSTVGITGDSVTMNADASDAVGVTKVEFYVDGTKIGEDTAAPYTTTWTIGSAGAHDIVAKAYDAAGNIGTSSSIRTYAGVKVTMTSPENGSVVKGLVTTFTATISDPFLNNTAYLYIDGVEKTYSTVAAGGNISISYTWDTNTLVNGSSHVIEIKGWDTSGTISTSVQSTVTVDNTPPNVNASLPGGIYNTPVNVTLTSDETADMYYTLDGSEPTTSSAIYSTPINISTDKTLKYFGQDTAGNSSPVKTDNYIIDTDGPAVTITSPTNGSTVKGTQNIQVDASDSQGISKIDLYIDDTIKSSGSTSPLTYSWDTGTYSEGTHTVSATVYDTVYNYSTVSSSVYVDRSIPEISNMKVTRNGTNAIVTWQTSEPSDSMVEYGTSDALGLTTPVDSNFGTNHKVTIKLQPNNGSTGQNFYFRAVSKDKAGNTVQSTVTNKIIKMFVGTWLMNGNYKIADANQALATDFIGGESAVEPFEGKTDGGKVWAKVETDTDQVVDFPTFMGSNIGYSNYDNTVTYVFTYVYSPVSQNVDVILGIDDQAKVWVNSNLVFTATNAATHTISNVPLNQGWNKVLIKAKNNTGGYSFKFAFTVPGQAQTPVNGLLYQTEVPNDYTRLNKNPCKCQ